MSVRRPPQEAAVASETAPLLGPTASETTTAVENSTNHGTFPETNVHAIAGAEGGEGSPSDIEDGPKLKVNMTTLLPALAVGVGHVVPEEGQTKQSLGFGREYPER
jgi:hypothetical protein